jgi:plasmid maintenance system killer protein
MNKILLILGSLLVLIILILIIGFISKKKVLKFNTNNKIPLKEDKEKLKKYSKDKHYFIMQQGQNHGIFSVYVNKNYVDVFIIPKNMNREYDMNNPWNDKNKNYYTEQVGSFKPQKVFVKDTMLIELSNNEYVYIGLEIYKFISKAKIISFLRTDIGSAADIERAYAIDINKNIYLLFDYVILEKYSIDYKKYETPYDYYYDLYESYGSNSKEIEELKKLTVKSNLKYKVIVD